MWRAPARLPWHRDQMGPHDAYVLRTVEERGVRFVRLWFVDVLGILKSLAIPASELEPRARGRRRARRLGAGGRGARRASATSSPIPTPATFELLPWRDGQVGRMFCTIRRPDGEPFAGRLARGAAARARRGRRPRLDRPGRRRGRVLPVRRRRRTPTLPHSRSTTAPTSTSRRSTRARTSAAARSTTSSRWASRSRPVAPRGRRRASTRSSSRTPTRCRWPTRSRRSASRSRRSRASWACSRRSCPSRCEQHAGSGMHLHLSLFDGDRNVFHDPDREQPLSRRSAASSSPASSPTPAS